MKKIAIVIADLVLGGGQRSALNLASALSKHYEVTVLVFQDEFRQYQVPCKLVNLNCPDQHSVLLKAYNVLRRTWRLRQNFNANNYDYIFGFMESANFPTALAAPQALLSVHCNPHELNGYESILLRLTYPRASHIIAVSEDVATILRSDFALKKVKRIYNLVSFEDIKQQASEESYTHRRPYLVALGRLTEVKRLDLLINAYANSRMRDECDLLLIGEGEMRESLESQVSKLSLEDQVIFTGSQSNPFKYLKSAELLALSSRTEAFPMVLIESLVLSCPVVATDCPTGPREIVIDGKNGLLVENGNQQALTEALDRLYFDKQLLAQCRAEAFSSVQHLSDERVVKEWLSLDDEHKKAST
ncbi:MAG: glycosyltransferase [Leucothrix sp.]